jgi:hypothetical protein
MSQNRSLRVELKPSLLLVCTLGLAHILALAAAVITLHGWPLLLVAAGVLVSGAVAAAEALHRTVGAARALELHADGRCAWRDGKGRWHEGRIDGPQFASTGLIVVALQANTRRHKWIVLLPDSAERESIRRLRLWVRWSADTPQVGGAGGND